MTNSNAFLSILNHYPVENQTDSDFRAVLVLGQKLAAQLAGSGNANPAINVGDFLAVHLASDPFAIAKYRAELNTLAERYARA
jgi:hypothetical protein